MNKGTKGALLGAGLTMAANGLHLISMYLVNTHPESPGDTFLFRAFLQILLFGVWSLVHVFLGKGCLNQRAVADEAAAAAEGGNRVVRVARGWRLWALVLVTNVLIAVTILLSYIGLKMMPLSDFIVFAFTSPIFTLIASALILRTRITFINAFFIFLIIFGAGLVTQPVFIFGDRSTIYQDTYTVGAVVGILVAFGGGTVRVLQAYCKQVPSCHFMLIGGFISLVIALAQPLFKVPCHLTEFSVILDESWMLFWMTFTSLIGTLLLLLAVKVTDPVLVAVVRSTEIVISLLIDIMFPSYEMDFSLMSFWYKVIGALIVTVSVMAISLTDVIYDKFMAWKGTPNCHHYQVIEGSDSDV